MRPLERLPNGNNYSNYKNYKNDLIDRYGKYCAYCEKADADLDVEHIEPKSKHKLKITDWNNLLLACPTCNRDFKRAFNDSRIGYVFPDVDETFEVFHYHSNGLIDGLTDEALKTIELCGLNRDAPEFSNRRAVIDTAFEFKEEMERTKIIPNVIPWVKRMGHWSIWMTVFHDVPEVIAQLSDPKHFPGTRPQFQKPSNPPQLVCPPP